MSRFIPLFALLMGLAPTGLRAQDSSCVTVLDLTHLSQEALDQASLAVCSAEQMILLLGAAEQLLQDTALALQVRGDVCFSLVADELQRRAKVPDFDPAQPAVAFLLERLAARQYHLALTRPTDWEKLLHYLDEGEYAYVGKRFVDRGGLTYLLLALSLGLLGWIFFKKSRRSPTQSL